MRQRSQRPVRYGRDRVREHADAARRLHQDDGEGERRGGASDHEGVQGLRLGGGNHSHWGPDCHEPLVHHWRGRHHHLPGIM